MPVSLAGVCGLKQWLQVGVRQPLQTDDTLHKERQPAWVRTLAPAWTPQRGGHHDQKPFLRAALGF